MTGKRYSAGAIFLQVVPVFANVQKAVADEAKNIDRALGDQMERSGEKAGERAGKAASKAMKDEVAKSGIGDEFERQMQVGVQSIDKALDGINTRNLGKKLRAEVKAMKAELNTLMDLDLSMDDNVDKVRAKVGALTKQIEDMRSRSSVFFDIKGLPAVYRQVAQLKSVLETIDGTVKLDVDTKPAERKMGAFERSFKKTADKAGKALVGSVNKEVRKLADELDYLGRLRIGIDLSGTAARKEINEVRRDLEDIARNSTDIDIKVDAGMALAELNAFEAALAKIDQDDAKVNVKVDVDDSGLRKASGSADDAANSFRSFNIILLAVTGAGPALIPVLAGIAGGLLALGPAAAVGAVGLGAALLGFSGLGDALGALQSQQDSAATNAQSNAAKHVGASHAIEDAVEALKDAQRNAARAAEDAEERVSDARRNAARAAEDAAERVADAREEAADAIEDAIKRQKKAQEEYRDAVEDVADAEQALRDARADAAADAASLADRQRKNALDERVALSDLFDAQVEYNAVMGDGSSTAYDKERASQGLEAAQIALNDTRTEQVALATEAADYATNGVEGAEGVKDAQDDLTDALEAQTAAQTAAAEAAVEVDKARIDGAEKVAEALKDQTEVIADNSRAVREALEDQAESHDDNARAIGRAKEALGRARESAVTDLAAIDSQALAVKNAFDKLGPAGAKFALFLFSLKQGFYEFRDSVQQAMLPAVQEAIEGFIGSANAGKAASMVIELARAFGEFTKALSLSFQGPAWAGFFEMMAETGPKISKAYGQAFISILEAFASILTTTAPFALDFAGGVAKIADSFAKWAASKSGQKQITDFLAYVKEIGPEVLAFFKSIAGAAAAAVKALAPYAEQVLANLTAIFDFVAAMDKDILAALLTGLTVVLFSSQVAYAVMNLMKAGAALFASTVGPWIFLIVGIGIALGYLYKTNEDFRDFIDEAWAKISAAFTKAWNDSIKPALSELWLALQYLWQEVLQPFFEWFGPILAKFIEKAIPLLATVFGMVVKNIVRFIIDILVPGIGRMVDVFQWMWNDILKPLWAAMSTAATWLWKNVLAPAFNGIKTAWDTAITGIKKAWTEVLKPVWDAIKNDALPALQTAFESTITAIGNLWDGLKKLVGTPIKFVIEKIINEGIIAGYNKVAGWVGANELGNVPVPDALSSYATGGILPGYTPGRDPHKFVSPTGGRLELSGGEAIMRPEFTAAVGPSFVNTMNGLAMSGGVNAVRKAMGYAKGGIMQAFAKGGIVFPVPGGYVERTAYNLGHDGMDINHPNDAGPSGQGGAVPFYSATSGTVVSGSGYGDAVFVASPFGTLVYGHSYPGSRKVAPGGNVSPGTMLGLIGNTGNSSGPHLHFGFPGGTFGQAEALLSGAPMADGKPVKPQRKIPSWLMGLVKDPLGAFKGWITNPLKDAAASFAATPFFDSVKKVPALLGKKVVDKVWDVIPGFVKTAAGWAGDGADWVVGGVKSAAGAVGDAAGAVGGAVADGAGAVGDFLGFADGGILPYNGTMMYDNGGYLPPGMTTVMNLTGKPEPVFTADQFDGMGIGGGDGFTYAPTFEGSNLTAADVVDDLDFTRRKIRREGRYGRSHL